MKKLLMVIPLALILCFVVSCQDKEAMAELKAMKAQDKVEAQNKAIILRWLNEVNESNFDLLSEELFAPDCEQYMPPDAEPMSFEEYKQLIKQFYSAFPEIMHTADDMIVEGDKVVARITAHTVHEREFFGRPPTGKELKWTAIAIFQLADGKIKTRWEIADMLSLFEQLGMELRLKEAAK